MNGLDGEKEFLKILEARDAYSLVHGWQPTAMEMSFEQALALEKRFGRIMFIAGDQEMVLPDGTVLDILYSDSYKGPFPLR